MKVKMWSRRLAGIPQLSDNAPDPYSIALPYANAARLKVLIKRVPPVAEIEDYVIATRIVERRSVHAFHYMEFSATPSRVATTTPSDTAITSAPYPNQSVIFEPSP